MPTGMDIALHEPVTLTVFLAWEDQQELRYEFYGFEPVAMTVGTTAYDQITFDLRAALAIRLAGTPCRDSARMSVDKTPRGEHPSGVTLC